MKLKIEVDDEYLGDVVIQILQEDLEICRSFNDHELVVALTRVINYYSVPGDDC